MFRISIADTPSRCTLIVEGTLTGPGSPSWARRGEMRAGEHTKMNMREAKYIPSPAPYASSGDFYRIFNREKDSLYRLSFLLTADREKANRCLVSGLEDSAKGNPVFRKWARSWARRTIIQNAVRLINPRPVEEFTSANFNSTGETPAVEAAELAAILDLRPFERFVFVMSVLEDYSEHECAILLGCSRRAVIAARSLALHQLRGAIEFSSATANRPAAP